MNSIEFKCFQGKEEFYKLETDWNIVVDSLSDKTIFHSYEWHKSYIDSIDDNDISIYFLLMYRDNTPIAIFPIERREIIILGFKYRVLRIPDYCQADHPLFDFIYNKHGCNINIMRHLTNYFNKNNLLSWDCISILNITENSSVYYSIKNNALPSSICVKGKNCYYFKCNDYDEVINRLSKNRKKSLNKSNSKVSKLGNIEYILLKNREELHKAFDGFLKLEASGWKGQQNASGEAIVFNYKEKKFFENLINNFSRIDGFECISLKADNKIIATLLCIKYCNTAYGLKSAYDEEYSKYSPSVVLLFNAFKEYSEDNNTHFFNTLSDAGWVASWKPFMYKGYNYFIFNNSLRGRLLSSLTSSAFFLRKLTKTIKNTK